MQKTIKKNITLEGVGVHTGERATITLKPAQPNAGITFINTAIPQEPLQVGTVIPEQAMHATVLKQPHWALSTVEHLMAALHGLGIDNLSIEITSASQHPIVEMPILDGSALPFVQAIMAAGVATQTAQKIYITPKKPLRFEDGDTYIEIKPATREVNASEPALTFTYSVDFDHPLIHDDFFVGCLSSFEKEIAPARTFGFLAQLPLLRKHGLAKGTSLGNTVVVGEEGFLNSRRFEDEFVRHKLLDLIGDLALVGKNLAGTITAHKTGHRFNRKVVEHYITQPGEWVVRAEGSKHPLNKRHNILKR